MNKLTYLEKLLLKRKVTRSYKKSSFDKNKLANIAKYSIKIPTAGFSRGIEIIQINDSNKINEIAYIFNEKSFNKDKKLPWISNSISLFFIILNEEAYHKRYLSPDKTKSVNSKNWDVPYWYVDSGAAVMNCMLLIEEAGLSSGFMGLHNIKRELIHNLLNIPDELKIIGLISAGESSGG